MWWISYFQKFILYNDWCFGAHFTKKSDFDGVPLLSHVVRDDIPPSGLEAGIVVGALQDDVLFR